MFDFFKDKRHLILLVLTFAFLFVFFGSAFMKRQENINIYNRGIQLLTEKSYQEAINVLSTLGDYQNASTYIEEATNRLIFENAKILYDAGRFEDSLREFSNIKNVEGYNGADEAQEYIEKLNMLFDEQDEKEEPYNEAINLYNNEDYEQALQIFQRLGDYRDTSDRIQECEKALLFQKRLQNATTISAGIRFSAGVTTDGKIVFSGRGYKGEAEAKEWSNIVSVAVNGEFLLGLKDDGKVVVVNGASKYRPDTEGWEDIIAISTGQQFIVGLKKDGKLLAQGYNGYGETDIDNWSNIIAISTGWQHTMGLDKDGDVFDEDGNVYFVGYNSEKISEEIKSDRERWSNLITISSGGSSPGYLGSGHVVGLKKDNTVVTAGDNSKGQRKAEDWSDIIAIAAGDFHTVGLKSDGTVITTLVEHNDSISKQLEERREKNLSTKAVAISAGYGTTLVLMDDGTVISAGYDNDGQLETSSWSLIAYYGK